MPTQNLKIYFELSRYSYFPFPFYIKLAIKTYSLNRCKLTTLTFLFLTIKEKLILLCWAFDIRQFISAAWVWIDHINHINSYFQIIPSILNKYEKRNSKSSLSFPLKQICATPKKAMEETLNYFFVVNTNPLTLTLPNTWHLAYFQESIYL